MTMTTTTKKTYYTCVADICGDCRVKHRSVQAADQCCSKHHRQIQRGNPGGGAYSDRVVVAVEDGIRRRLTDDEQDC